MLLKILTLIVFLFVINSLQVAAQNQSPQVTNVAFSQRTDGSFFVDVYYDVNDPEGSLMTVSMQASSNNGITWDFSANNITGDVGANITNGTGKHIEWDFGSEHPQTFGDQFRIKILADDGNGTMGEPCPGTPTITYEGKTYNTVQIGDQCWLRENIDVGTRIDGSQNASDNGVIEKYCYNNDPANCTTYGGLYQWNEAMQYVTNEGTKGICPVGWHIPTSVEFQTLSSGVGYDGNALKEIGQGTGGGAGTNTSGFSALLAGNYDYNYGGAFNSLGDYSWIWLSTEYNAVNAFAITLFSTISVIITNNPGNKNYGFSVRCIKG